MPPLTMATSRQLAQSYGRDRGPSMRADEVSALARRLSGITDTFPHLNAATAMALAEAGYDRDSVEVKTVGNLQAKRDEDLSAWGRIKSHWEDSVENHVKPVARVALTALDAPREMVAGGFRRHVAQITGDAPAQDMDLLGVRPFQDLARGEHKTFNQSRLGAAFQIQRESKGEINAVEALNNIPSAPRDGDWSALLDREEQTWFSGPNSLAEKRQVANARAAGQVNGRATTYGRAVGALVGFQPGGAAYELMSSLMAAGDKIAGENPLDITEGATEAEKRASFEKNLGRAQVALEGGIDAAATFTPLDPVGFASGAIGKTQAAKGRFGGRTVEVDLPDNTTIVAKAKDKATGEVRDVPITVEGTRKTVVFENAVDFVTKSKKGDRLAQYIAAEADYTRMAQVLGRGTSPATVIRLLDETDPAQVKNILLDEISKGFIDAAPKAAAADFAAVGLPANKVASVTSATLFRPKSRQRQLMPSETFVYRSEPAWAVEQYRRMLEGMRTGDAKNALSRDFISKNVEDFARGVVDENADWTAPYIAALDAAEEALLANRVPREVAKELTSAWRDQVTEHRHFWIDRHGKDKAPFLTIDGADADQAKASVSAEMFTDGIPLIDPVQFSRAASKLRALVDSPGWEGLVASGDAVTALFKFMVLPTRGVAWAMRNVAELQARLAVEGLESSAFTHPLASLAWRIGDNPDSKASRLLGRADRAEGRGAFDPAGDDFRLRAELEGNLNAFARAQEHKGGPWVDHRSVYLNNFPVMAKGDLGFLEGNRFSLTKLAGSEEVRMVAQAENPQHAKNLFWKSKVREKMARQHPELATRQGADAWVDGVIYPRIQDATNGNPALVDAIRTGRLNGVPLITRDARGNLSPDKKILAELEKHWDDLPDFTVTQGTARVGGDPSAIVRGAEAVERMVFNQLFAAFGSVPSNRFVNSPLMRELTWRNAIRLAPLASVEGRKALVVNARKANLSRAMVRELAAVSGPAGKMDARDIRDLAEHKAFDQWLDIVYTSHRKGNWTRSVRMMQPFAAAVADMYRFWSKRLTRNPLILHRVELGMRSARSAGFFYTDENGEERFAYPGSGAIIGAVTGVGAGFSATVKGANMITSGLVPGFGPIVSWPVGWFTPDKPEWDEFRAFINPYGDPDGSGGLLEGIAPRHIQQIMAALDHGSSEQKRLYQEALGDVQAYLMSTGEYGTTVEEQQRLRRDAKAKGKMLWLVKAFAAGSLPASPKAEFQFKDPTGRIHAIALIAADYRKLANKDFETANQRVLEKYGDAVFYAVTGGTEGTQLATEASHDFARTNPDLVDRYDMVWSFFTDPASPYSYREFRRQLDSSERTPRDLKERAVEAQTRIAQTMYHQYKDQFGPFPTTEESDYLRMVKGEIRKQYPLWDDSFDVKEVQGRVTQAFAAARDDAFKGSPVSDAVLAYEKARRSVIDAANSAGLTDSETGWGRAKATEDHRDYLRFVGASLAEQVSEFKTLWERVFQREMVDDLEGQP